MKYFKALDKKAKIALVVIKKSVPWVSWNPNILSEMRFYAKLEFLVEMWKRLH